MQLILALYRSGRQSDALAAYRSARETLDELGLEPTPALRELEGASSATIPRSPRPRFARRLAGGCRRRRHRSSAGSSRSQRSHRSSGPRRGSSRSSGREAPVRPGSRSPSQRRWRPSWPTGRSSSTSRRRPILCSCCRWSPRPQAHGTRVRSPACWASASCWSFSTTSSRSCRPRQPSPDCSPPRPACACS
jgi:transcriptional activator